jgi:hypothetical protein
MGYEENSSSYFGQQDQSVFQHLRIQPGDCWLSLCWLVERERKGDGENPFTPPHPEWNSLCWLVESKREERGGG